MNAPRDLEEIVSAIVDGELDAEEVERAFTDPEVAQRVEEVTAARDQLRNVPPAPDTSRATAVAAALDAVAPVPSSPAPAHAPTPPGRRAGGSPRWLAPVAVAAGLVVFAVVAGVALLQQGDDNDADSFAASDDAEEGGSGTDMQADVAPEESEAFDEDAAAGPEAGAVPGEPGAGEDTGEGAGGDDDLPEEPEAADGVDRGTADGNTDAGDGGLAPAGSTWLDLGIVADADDLEDRVVAVLRGEETARDTGDDTVHPTCGAGQPGGDPDLDLGVGDETVERSRLSAVAELGGEQVWIQVYPGDDGRALLLATNPACRHVVDQIIWP